MKYYKHNDGKVFAFEDDGTQDDIISDDFRPMTEAEIDAHLNPPIDPRQKIINEIDALELEQTPRRIREAALSDAGRAWLENLDAQIAALRAQINN